MISFLKESTFIVNEVLNDAWEVLRKRYFAIAGLCLAMFLTSNLSAILGFHFNALNTFLSILIALFFVFLYFGVQLTLFKHIFQVLDKNPEDVRLKYSLPNFLEISYFLFGMVSVLLLSGLSYFFISALLMPLIYLNVPIHFLVSITMVLSFVFIILMGIRLIFFPFFIIDQGKNTFSALRFSLAITRGNVIKLLMLLAFFVMLNLLYLYFSYLKLAIISTGLSLVNSFLVVPLASVAITVAYRKMMSRYHGSSNPEVLKNII